MAPTTPAAIRTASLTKHYGRHPALESLDLTVPVGCVFGFLGPNGAGKTTTLRLLAGLLRPTSGSALVAGIDVATDRDEVQRRLGYLPGDFAGYRDLTGRQFLGLLASLRGGVDQDHVRGLAERLDLDLDRRMGDLSRGNRQKVGLIQAFMHRADVLLLDEPTTGLDPIMQREFLSIVTEVRDEGRTVLLSTHVLSEVEVVADHVAIIDQGRLLVTSTVDALRSTTTRILDLRFAGPVPTQMLTDLPSVESVHVSGGTARVVVRGSTAALVRALAPYEVVDVATHQTELADVFLSFYRQKGNTDDPQRVRQGLVGPEAEPARLG